MLVAQRFAEVRSSGVILMPGEQTEGRFSAEANLTLVVSIMFATPLKPSFQSTSAARASRSSPKRSWNLMIRAGSTASVRSSSPGKCRTRLRALLNVRPTTLAGVQALLRYAVEANVDDCGWPEEVLDDDGSARPWHKCLVESVAAALPQCA